MKTMELEGFNLIELDFEESKEANGGFLFLIGLAGSAGSLAAGASLVALVGAGLYHGWTAYE